MTTRQTHSSGSRKRKRNVVSVSSMGTANENVLAGLPHIPGVPMELIPQFLQALRSTTNFYQKQKSSPYTVVGWHRQIGNENSATVGHEPWNRNDNIDNNRTNNGNNVYDSIMNRMENAVSTEQSSSTDPGLDRELNMKRAIERWMEDVKHAARRKHPSSRKDNSHGHVQEGEPRSRMNGDDVNEKEKPSIPYSFFLYLWGMQQEHDRVAVRRSALLLSGLLLEKSRDCRFHLEQESYLSEWVSNIVANGVIWKNQERALSELPLLQREAFALLNHLIDKGYGNLYPKIGVAAKSLRHQCPNLEIENVSTNTSMSEWRRLRDFALRHGQEEIDIVKKLLNRADQCLHTLVPRVGVSVTADSVNTEEKKQHSGERDSFGKYGAESSDESDVEWEDGDGLEDEAVEGRAAGSRGQDAHISAVERTIAAMEAAGTTVLRGGELEIDFDLVGEEGLQDQSGPEIDNSLVRKKLQKCVRKMADPHLKRLTAWLEGLRNADNLVLQSNSLVSLDSKQLKFRLNLIEDLSEIKVEISRVLSSASRLNVEARNEDAKAPPSRAIALSNPLGMGPATNERLDSLMRRRKQKSKSSRSSRIQIKCESR